ncbi:MAG: GAF domain-containing protein [Acidobacteria bacterium]|nr:MAG: GAF domain-containing protein [Acidobacteriota bacterium]
MLRDAGTLANPRFGVDQTIDALLERLREFYEAEACVLTTSPGRGAAASNVHCWERHCPGNAARVAALSVDELPWLPPDAVVVYVRSRQWWPGPARVWCGERMGGRLIDGPRSCHPAIAEDLLDQVGGRSWLSVPVYADQRHVGRLHIIRERGFEPSDAEFALQVMESGMLLIENVRLVDQLASSAALRERERVARDIHDSVIQPYIGLQLGLVAVQRTLESGNLATAEAKVRRLVDLTNIAIEDLRSGVHDLKGDSTQYGSGLPRALRLHVARFAEDTGIPVDIEGIDTVRCGDRLAAELFQMAVEALSNVRRHTAATRAAVRFKTDAHHVRLQVENLEPAKGRTPFMPRSLSERAAALGGSVTVDRYRDGRSIVEVTIPL